MKGSRALDSADLGVWLVIVWGVDQNQINLKSNLLGFMTMSMIVNQKEYVLHTKLPIGNKLCLG